MPDISFEQLIAPLEPGAFFRDYWQKDSLLAPTTDRVRDLVSLADIELLVSSLISTGPDWIQVVKTGSRLEPAAFCTDESFVSLPKLYSAYRAGYTIQLSKLHKRWPPVGRLARAAEAAFTAAGVPLAHRIGSHLYLTPAHSTGFTPHYDSHDVVVVQVAGAKRWKVYGAREEFPVAMQMGDVPRDQLPPLRHDVLLEAGQILYIPRGIFHEALSEDQFSVHVTLDIFPYTWSDLVSRIMLAQPRFRESLPVGAWTATGASPELVEGFRERLQGLGDFAGLDSLAVSMLKNFIENLDTLPDDGFEQMHRLESVTLDSVVERRPGAFARVLTNGGNPELRFPGSGFGGPEVLAPVFRYLEASPRFVVRELPDFLSGASKIEITRELIREGFLGIAGPTPPQ